MTSRHARVTWHTAKMADRTVPAYTYSPALHRLYSLLSRSLSTSPRLSLSPAVPFFLVPETSSLSSPRNISGFVRYSSLEFWCVPRRQIPSCRSLRFSLFLQFCEFSPFLSLIFPCVPRECFASSYNFAFSSMHFLLSLFFFFFLPFSLTYLIIRALRLLHPLIPFFPASSTFFHNGS